MFPLVFLLLFCARQLACSACKKNRKNKQLEAQRYALFVGSDPIGSDYRRPIFLQASHLFLSIRAPKAKVASQPVGSRAEEGEEEAPLKIVICRQIIIVLKLCLFLYILSKKARKVAEQQAENILLSLIIILMVIWRYFSGARAHL